jgi:hypothetical protein
MRSVCWHAARVGAETDFYRTCGSDPVEHRRSLAIQLDHPHLLTRTPVIVSHDFSAVVSEVGETLCITETPGDDVKAMEAGR